MTQEELKFLNKTIEHIDEQISGLQKLVERTSTYYADPRCGEKRTLIIKETKFFLNWKWSEFVDTIPMHDRVAIALNKVCKEQIEELKKLKQSHLDKLNII